MVRKSDLPFVIHENASLRHYNTFGMAAYARYFCEVDTHEMLKEALDFAARKSLTPFIIGGGSNIVLLEDLDTLVIHMKIKGVAYQGDQVSVMAGENWHQFVRQMIREGHFGLENLSLIPGTVGGAPIQNIGAYGVELSERLVSITALDKKSGKEISLSNTDCEFGYRDSIFKRSLKNQLVILSITLALDKYFTPRLDYSDLERTFKDSKKARKDISAMDVSDALIKIRSAKLPDPKVVGNAGSFFKNPIISQELLSKLRTKIQILNPQEIRDGYFKVPAAMLIGEAGLKGMAIGDAMVSKQHALVLTNLGSASSEDLMRLIEKVQEEVKLRFSIDLEVEPELIC